MRRFFIVVMLVLVSLQCGLFGDGVVRAHPLISRIKRVSDQRLAELETLVALSKMSGKLVTVPLGYGKIDPKAVGRKRRSDFRLLKLFGAALDDTSDFFAVH